MGGFEFLEAIKELSRRKEMQIRNYNAYFIFSIKEIKSSLQNSR
jgi:hypothetical protein